jgi:O-acetyl-ADP-ribose deacetylase (regulator of RNase III)
MPYVEMRGNIFNANADALVNTINCVGAMGKGIALEFRRRFPDMFAEYQRLCEARQIRPGQIWPYTKSRPAVLNFAIKDDWHLPSRVEWIEECLVKFVNNRHRLAFKSVAFPWMGAMNGGIPIDVIKALMRTHLAAVSDVDIAVYEFDPDASDPLFRRLEDAVAAMPCTDFAAAAHVAKRTAAAIYAAMENHPTSLFRLMEAANLGISTADKLYAFLVTPPPLAQTRDLFTTP